MATFYEEFKIKSQDLVEKVKSILHEGNVRRIILKDEKGHTFLEIPLSVAAVGVVAAPLLAGLGAIAAQVGLAGDNSGSRVADVQDAAVEPCDPEL